MSHTLIIAYYREATELRKKANAALVRGEREDFDIYNQMAVPLEDKAAALEAEMEAATAPATRGEPTAELAYRFKTMLQARNMGYTITWQWDATGKNRHGVIRVFYEDKPGTVDEAVFARSTHVWADADSRIGKLRTGSPKTLAIKALLARLEA